YAVFYAIEGLLVTKHLDFSKHAGVIAAFNQHFIKSGIFPKEFSRMIERLFRNRQIGDYGFELTITEDDAKEDVKMAEQLMSAIENYLVQNNFLQKIR
ncbi:MAG: HEPN domain-containing protein, partial [candidate division KSB1 bacterium]|nr:HEPN domain-containing protein [candidate division KSB1 bacterium]